jgi:hypothetical protein
VINHGFVRSCQICNTHIDIGQLRIDFEGFPIPHLTRAGLLERAIATTRARTHLDSDVSSLDEQVWTCFTGWTWSGHGVGWECQTFGVDSSAGAGMGVGSMDMGKTLDVRSRAWAWPP